MAILCFVVVLFFVYSLNLFKMYFQFKYFSVFHSFIVYVWKWTFDLLCLWVQLVIEESSVICDWIEFEAESFDSRWNHLLWNRLRKKGKNSLLEFFSTTTKINQFCFSHKKNHHKMFTSWTKASHEIKVQFLCNNIISF